MHGVAGYGCGNREHDRIHGGHLIRRRSIFLVFFAAGLLLLVGVLVLWVIGSANTVETAPGPPIHAPTSASESISLSPSMPAGSVNPAPPSSQELDELEAAMASSDLSAVGPYLPIGPGQDAEADFAAQLAGMGLTVHTSSLEQIEPGLWSVVATDASGQGWSIGLVRPEGHLRMFSAEMVAE